MASPDASPAPVPRPLRVLYFGTYRAGYTRNQILLKGLRARGVEVVECHAALWHGIEDRVAVASGGWARPGFVLRLLRAWWQLLRAHGRAPDYDVMLIGYPGQLDAFLGRWLARRRRRPVVLDVLMSLHLVAEERGLTARSPLSGRLLAWLEGRSLERPDCLLMENGAYRDYLCAKYGLDPARFRAVPHGADESFFVPGTPPGAGPEVRVVYFGGYLPSHGLDLVMGAAARLQGEPRIRFHCYGDGPERDRIQAEARDRGLSNVMFHGFVSRDELLAAIRQAHLCLGVFGTTPQARMTVQNKVWETLAMGRPLISGDSPAIREVLAHAQHLFLVPRNDAALAEGILALALDPVGREAMAARGHQQFLAHNAVPAIGAILEQVLVEVTRRQTPR